MQGLKGWQTFNNEKQCPKELRKKKKSLKTDLKGLEKFWNHRRKRKNCEDLKHNLIRDLEKILAQALREMVRILKQRNKLLGVFEII
jgi:hypothetical protein